MTELEERPPTSAEIYTRIQKSLHTRSAERGTLKGDLEDVAKTAGVYVWKHLKKRTLLGVALTGGATLALASTFGVGELALAILAGYGAYQVLREGVSPHVAAENVMREIERFG